MDLKFSLGSLHKLEADVGVFNFTVVLFQNGDSGDSEKKCVEVFRKDRHSSLRLRS